ncbi:MAG: DUF2889 domain-containing protein [Actinomycetota bacterium]
MAIPIHTRSYQCEAFAEDDGRLRVRGRLVDTKEQGLALVDGEPLEIHNMVIDLYVDPGTFEIVEVAASMDTHPYDLCTSILADYQQLVGLSISRGYSRRVKELFGGPNGCTHIGALLQAMGPVAVQANWSLVNLHEDLESLAGERGDAEDRERRVRLNTNTCHVWREDGPQMNAVSRGVAVSPDWEIDRLNQLGADAG